MTSDLHCAADSVQIEHLLLDEAGVAALRQATRPKPSEEGGRAENLFRQPVAVTPHNVKETHTGDEAWERRARETVGRTGLN